MSGAVCLLGMLFFSATGITLNHAGAIPADPRVEERTIALPPALLDAVSPEALGEEPAALPEAVERHVSRQLGVSLTGRPVEWSEYDAYVSLPRPGGDAWLSLDRETGEVLYEETSRGAVSYLNDLHKGRNTGAGWRLFLDLFAVAAILFSLTGLWLLQISAKRRPSTWPLTAAGLAVPVMILLVFVH